MVDKKKQTFLFRKKIKFFLKPILIISLIFIVYQLIMFVQLTKSPEKEADSSFILGVHELQKKFYKLDDRHFTCVQSMEKIDIKYVNDNYCDCLDGSDEPGTNACSNGHFFCAKQIGFPKSIASSKVNDGICDCCDGSDEWSPKQLSFRLSDEVQKKLGRYQSPCPVLC